VSSFTLPLKAHFHYGKNCAKLVGFSEQKKYFGYLKHPNLERLNTALCSLDAV
jgi:hypothetical protein